MNGGMDGVTALRERAERLQMIHTRINNHDAGNKKAGEAVDDVR